jgi:hypothetical protein
MHLRYVLRHFLLSFPSGRRKPENGLLRHNDESSFELKRKKGGHPTSFNPPEKQSAPFNAGCPPAPGWAYAPWILLGSAPSPAGRRDLCPWPMDRRPLRRPRSVAALRVHSAGPGGRLANAAAALVPIRPCRPVMPAPGHRSSRRCLDP